METIYKSMESLQVGQIHNSKSYGQVEILGREKKPNGQYRYFVKFLNTNNIKAFAASHILSGEIADKTVPSFWGKGYIGDGKFKTSHQSKPTKEGHLWINMLQRCYSDQYLSLCPSYANVSVCDRWLNFQNFCEDLPLIENYNNWLTDKSYVLDKDLKQSGNDSKIYSLQTCVFIRNSENTKLSNISKNSYKGINPEGVVFYFSNQREFAESNNLTKSGISSVIRGDQKTHRGWSFEKLTNS